MSTLPISLDTVQGIWRRSYLKSAGHCDTSTWVRWMQAGDIHIDLRLSPTFNCLPSRALHEQEPSSLLEIASVTAFAGSTRIANSVCTWTRLINYAGPQTAPDVGSLTWSGDTLVEAGVHDEYEEGWELERRGGVQAHCLARPDGQVLFLCVSSDHFAMARAHPKIMRESTCLAERVNAALCDHDETTLVNLFDQEFCFGIIEQGSAQIVKSSNPSRIGCCAFRFKGPLVKPAAIDATQEDFLGRTTVHRYVTNLTWQALR